MYSSKDIPRRELTYRIVPYALRLLPAVLHYLFSSGCGNVSQRDDWRSPFQLLLLVHHEFVSFLFLILRITY
jgi:hypothetical protein